MRERTGEQRTMMAAAAVLAAAAKQQQQAKAIFALMFIGYDSLCVSTAALRVSVCYMGRALCCLS